MTPQIFIDGDVGTTGLQIKSRLEGRLDIELLCLDNAIRKNPEARAEMLNRADISVLCLPDDASIEAVSMISNPDVRLIDASTAHRIADGWVYGFPEYSKSQSSIISKAKRVSNPGCYALTSISILHPLVQVGLLPADWPISINAISGYSGGGKGMISQFEEKGDSKYTEAPFFAYGLSLEHKHLPEITHWSGIRHSPLFVPSVGRYAQGMIVQVPLPLWSMQGGFKAIDIHDALAYHYSGQKFVSIAPLSESKNLSKLEPQSLNGSNQLRLYVFADESEEQVVVAGLLDNLGKGAAGQAVQNLNLMLGIDESTGL